MKSFWIRTTSILLIAGAVLAYDGCLHMREQDQQIAELTAQVEGYEQWESEVRQALETTAAASDTASNEAEEEEGFQDGSYEGSAQGFGGTVKVSVTIKKGKIDAIDIISASGEDSAYFSMAKKVIDDILDSQSPDVDTISGATFSSTGIINAVAEALSEAWQ